MIDDGGGVGIEVRTGSGEDAAIGGGGGGRRGELGGGCSILSVLLREGRLTRVAHPLPIPIEIVDSLLFSSTEPSPT